MHTLEPLEIGLMFWAKEDARQTLKEVKAYGVRAGQLGFPGDMMLDRKAEQWASALWQEHFAAVAAVCSYAGEDYADIPTVKRTVGLVPDATRVERVSRTKCVANVAQKLGIASVACHIGFVPHDTRSLAYRKVCDLARDICDHCGRLSQSFTLETGQEPANALLQFLHDVGRTNLKINFDPANMILYGTGDPIDALGLLKDHVISVHCKDGDWPPKSDAAALGKERALGKGGVDFPRFIKKLQEIGYQGVLTLEREEPNEARKAADVRSGLALLRELTGRT